MSIMKAAKHALRKEMKKTISLLTSEQKKCQSDIVTKKFLESEKYLRSRRISVFINMDDEIETTSIIQNIFQSGKFCFIPRYASNSTDMEMVRLKSYEDLEKLPLSSWNIKQPLESEQRENALETGGLDLVVVPGLAFTADGKRMGRGKGYYDTFLSRCRKVQNLAPTTVALAFRQQVLSHVPTDINDMDIDLVIFPES